MRRIKKISKPHKKSFFTPFKIILYSLCLLVILIFGTLHLYDLNINKQSGWGNITLMQNKYLPATDSIVVQYNIASHVTQRKGIYILYPEVKTFNKNSPCGKTICNWFRWDGFPNFLMVDISPEWNERDYLTKRDKFIDGLNNLDKSKVIQFYKRIGNTIVYSVNINPNSVLFDYQHGDYAGNFSVDSLL